MGPRTVLQRIIRRVFRRHGKVKSFDRELESAGGITGRADLGAKTVPVAKVVGSVGRTHNMRSDFFYVSGKVTQRFVRIGQAMKAGKTLPPIDVYKLKRSSRDGAPPPVSEYYVVDGHHRVAMARKLGQDFLDANVVEYTAPGTAPATHAAPPSDPASSPSSADDAPR